MRPGVTATLALALFPLISVQLAGAQEVLSLEQAIRIAQENNFGILSAREAVQGAEHRRKSALADFFPKLSAQGNYTLLNETPVVDIEETPPTPVFATPTPGPNDSPIGFVPGSPAATREVGEQQLWSVQGSAVQTVFAGGALLNRYRLARLGVDSARTTLGRTRQDLSLQVVRSYFNVLNAIEQKNVADQAVRLLENQRDVAREFYNVGMIPKNDLLQTEVKLAERIREQTRAENNIELAKAQLNVVLQRPINSPVELENILQYKAIPGGLDLEAGIEMALERRLEIREAKLKVEAGEREVRLAQSTYFPQVRLSYNLFKTEGRSFQALEEGWTVAADATWSFWEWGKKHHDVSAARSDLLRDRYALFQLRDRIALEVKEAYLALRVTEKNIFVAKKAIEQGEENFRMNQERYREQVGTITEVLDAQTLLTQAQTDYFNALRNYNVAKAALRRALGLKVYEPLESHTASAAPSEP